LAVRGLFTRVFSEPAANRRRAIAQRGDVCLA
jgi:hypothetical protein